MKFTSFLDSFCTQLYTNLHTPILPRNKSLHKRSSKPPFMFTMICCLSKKSVFSLYQKYTYQSGMCFMQTAAWQLLKHNYQLLHLSSCQIAKGILSPFNIVITVEESHKYSSPPEVILSEINTHCRYISCVYKMETVQRVKRGCHDKTKILA